MLNFGMLSFGMCQPERFWQQPDRVSQQFAGAAH